MAQQPDLRENSTRLKLGLIQMACGEDNEENFRKGMNGVREAASQGARVICLQELFRSRYFCQSENTRCFDLAEPIPGSTTSRLEELARELQVVLVASLFEKRTSGLYHNSVVTIDTDGTMLGLYRKMHIPDDPYYYEKFYFTPGDLGFQSHPTRYGSVGTLICWDQWFPEAARITALKGAQIVLYPTAIGWLPGESEEMNQTQKSAWETIQRAHAISNGVFVASVNRVGIEGKLTFWGGSFVSDPFGRILAQASSVEEEVLVVECDLAQIEETRRNWPFLRDRRIDAYNDLSNRFLDKVTGE